MSKEKTIEKIIDYFKENENIFNDCIEELDSYNGYLGDDRYYEMEMLNEFYSGTEPIDILYRAFYGHDDDNYITDGKGNREYKEFNPNREYFYFNGYGNLVSSNYKDYSAKLDDYFVENLIENKDNIYCIDNTEELKELLEELENEE